MSAEAQPATAAKAAPSRMSLAFILLSCTLILMGGAAVAPALPLISEAFPNDSEATISLIITLPSLVIAFVGFFIGGLADRFGTVRVLVLSLLVFTVAGVSGYFLSSLTTILIGRAILGFSLAGIMTTTTTIIILNYSGQARAKVMGMQSAAMGLGIMFLEMSGGALAGYGWRTPFLIYVLGVIFMFGVLAFVKEPSREESHDSLVQGPPKLIPYIVIACCVGVLILELTTFLIPTKIPYLVEETGSGAMMSGLVLGVFGLVSAVTGLFHHRAVSGMHPLTAVAISFLLIGVGIALLGFGEGIEWIIGCMFLAGIGGGMIMPILGNWISLAVPLKLLGRVMGIYGMCIYIGQFMSSIVAVPVLDYAGGSYGGMFAIMGGVTVILAVVFGVMRLVDKGE